jgi:hypothetical protein
MNGWLISEGDLGVVYRTTGSEPGGWLITEQFPETWRGPATLAIASIIAVTPVTEPPPTLGLM